MPKEEPDLELKRLHAELNKARRDEVFGGLSPAELAECSRKSERIRELESEIRVRAVAKQSSGNARAEQTRQWNKDPETDTPQSEAHLPYRSREKDSTDSSTDSRREREPKKAPEEKGSE